MKRIRDGEGTRSRVIAAAEDLFSRHGFNGTSMSMIAETSGTSVGLILHHFKTKDDLYRVVRNAASAAYVEHLKENFRPDMTLSETGPVMMRAAYRYFSDHPAYIRLVWWAYLEGKEIFSDNEKNLALTTFKIVKEAQQKGAMKKNISPHVILSVLLGALHYWVSRREILEKLEPANMGRKEAGRKGPGRKRPGQSGPDQNRNDDWFIDDLIDLLRGNEE